MSIPENFDNLPQRAVFYFLNTMPEFNKIKSSSVTTKEQENAYNFIKSIYQNIFDNPNILGFKLVPDDCFKTFWSRKKDKPALTSKVKGMVKKINEFIEIIYKIIYNGTADNDTVTVSKFFIDIKPAACKKLAALGIIDIALKDDEKHVFIFPDGKVKGLKLLAKISAEYAVFNDNSAYIETKNMSESMLFSRGVFNPKVNFNREVFERIAVNKISFNRAVDYLEKSGFKRIENKLSRNGYQCVTLDYVKFYPKKDEKITSHIVGEAWKTNVIAGVEFTYYEACQIPLCVRFHVPNLKEFLENHEKMSDLLKNLISDRQKCTNCRYCVTFDKTKTKTPCYVNVGNTRTCPIFNFGMSFHDIGGNLWFSGLVTEVMELIDEIFTAEVN